MNGSMLALLSVWVWLRWLGYRRRPTCLDAERAIDEIWNGQYSRTISFDVKQGIERNLRALVADEKEPK